MPLDPKLGDLIAAFGQLGGGGLASGTAEQFRDMFTAATVSMRDPSTLAPVRAVEDSTIPGPAGPIPIRIYRPDVGGPTPTLAFFHGGGFVVGTIETHDDQARLICRDGEVTVVSVEYRLAPEHPYPAAFDDCLAATRWAADRIHGLGRDPQRLAVGGDSAGGNLAAAVALAMRGSDPALAGQFLIYPVVDFATDAAYPSRVDNASGYLLTADDMAWFDEQYVPADADRSDPTVSPIRAASLAGAPPAIIGTAEFDPLRDEGEAYARALADAGVDVRYARYDGMIHGFFGLGLLSPAAADAVADMTAALRDLLH